MTISPCLEPLVHITDYTAVLQNRDVFRRVRGLIECQSFD
jgi:hypothetical protein